METATFFLSVVAAIVSVIAIVEALQANTKSYRLQVLQHLSETYLARYKENERIYSERLSRPGGGRLSNPFETENQELLNAANTILDILEKQVGDKPGFAFPAKRTTP